MKRLWIVATAIIVGMVACEERVPSDSGTKPEEDVSGIRLNYEIRQERSAKRGVSFNFQFAEDVELMSKGVSWSYNWGPSQGGASIVESMVANDMRFYPMAWNGSFSESRIREWKEAHPDTEYILAFNEPNLTDQANMTPQAAAEHWPRLVALAKELDMKLIAPAMNYGTLANYHDPIKWLDEFFSIVPIEDVDGIAIHCYMASPTALKSYVQRFYKYNLPIWLTEFCAWEESIGDAKAQARFMSQCLGYLESDPNVAGYAWFIPRGAADENTYPFYALLTKTQPLSLTALGELYANYSSFDKTTYYSPEEVIPAESFRLCNASETATESGWEPYVQLQPTTDVTGVLEIADMFGNQWVEYGLYSPDGAERALLVRYTTPSDAILTFALGDQVVRHAFPATGDNNWRTECVYVTPAKGESVMRVGVMAGRVNINWLSLR